VATPSQAVPAPDLLGDLTFLGRSVLYVHEVAEKLRCSQQHVYDLIDEGRLPAIDLTGAGNLSARRSLRIPAAGFRMWLTKQQTALN
jgi:excisionase family DNA binding protein